MMSNQIKNRWGILNVYPTIENGKYLAKCVENEIFPIRAKVFREGHDSIGATIVIRDTRKREYRYHMEETGYKGDDDWVALVKAPETIGKCEFFIEGWHDSFKTWYHNAEIKIPINQDIELTFEDGARIIERWLVSDSLTKSDVVYLGEIASKLKNRNITPEKRFELAKDARIWEIYKSNPFRENVSCSDIYYFNVERKLSSFCSWYQFFPRSVGAKKIEGSNSIVPGTFETAAKELTNVKAMGFDVIYIPPIHPIGETYRKGRNNSLIAGRNDPGSPWAVGNRNGGHDAINPDLGNESSFKKFVNTAIENNLEVSIDLALQCSPDHPWVSEHPEWFTVRSDGSIAYAENPPKKYQDIYPLNFDKDPEGLYGEILRIVKYWIRLGVTVFRVDNPHTKPIWVWERLIKDVNRLYPNIIWLAEAFTLPAMMKQLGLIGYNQSHSYFLWRNTKHELEQFLSQISGDDAFWYRASLWPTTPDNLTDYLANGGVAAHAIRAVLAAMGSTTWGIYSGYELVEDKQRINDDGSIASEHQNNEKYEIKIRDWSKADKIGIKQLITKLNHIRKKHVSCENIHSLNIQSTDNENIIAFTRYIPAKFTNNNKSDMLIVVVNLDARNAQSGTVHLDWSKLNLPEYFNVREELSGKNFRLTRSFYVELSPYADVAHIFSLED